MIMSCHQTTCRPIAQGRSQPERNGGASTLDGGHGSACSRGLPSRREFGGRDLEKNYICNPKFWCILGSENGQLATDKRGFRRHGWEAKALTSEAPEGVGNEFFSLQPNTKSEERHELPAGSGAEPRPKTDFSAFRASQNASR